MPINPFLFNAAILAASIFIIFKAADYVVEGISSYAKKLGLSDYLVGFLIVSMVASAPEIVASFNGILMQDLDVTFGTILGTNMIHLVLILGILILFARKVVLRSPVLEKYRVILMLFYALPILLISDGQLSRPDGVVLLAAFAFYIFFVWSIEGTLGKLKKEVKLKAIWKDALLFILAILAVLLAGRWLVYSAVNLANLLKIPTFFVALTVIAFSSALPDFAIMFRALRRKHFEIGAGEALGSALFELLFYFGLISTIYTITITFSKIMFVSILLLISIGILLFNLRRKVTWRLGLILVLIYLVFISFEIVKNFV